MGIYFSLIDENHDRVVINRVKLLYIGNIWEEILTKEKILCDNECMELEHDYQINGKWFPLIIDYYCDILRKSNSEDICRVISNYIVNPLKELSNSEDNTYIIRLD